MRISLRVKIGLTVISLVVIGGVVTAYLVYANSSNALKNSIGSNLATEDDQTVDKLDRFLYERQIDIQELSDRSLVQAFLADSATRTANSSVILNNQLKDFKALVGNWADFSILDTKGNVLITTDQPAAASELSQQPQFNKVVQSAESGKIAYSDVIKEKSTGSNVTLFTSVVRDNQVSGKPIVGVVVGELAWPSVLEILSGLSGRAELLNSKGISLGDNSGKPQNQILVQDHSKSQAFIGSRKSGDFSGVLPGLDDSNNTYLIAATKENGYLDFRGNNWTLVLQKPQSTAFAPARQLAKELIIIFVGALILSVGVLIWVSDWLVIAPINRLKEVVERLSDGDFSLRARINSHDELGALSQGFNDMADNLQNSGLKLREEHARLESSIDSLNIGLLMTFVGTEAISYNPAALHILKISRDTVKLKAAQPLTLDLIAPILKGFDMSQAINKAQKSGVSFYGTQVPYGNKVLSLSCSPIVSSDKRILGAVMLIEDVTEAKVMERSKDEFFSIASHELRTPLTSIKGNAAMIMDYYAEQLKDPDLKEMISDIRTSSERLIEIVNDFLDLSRLEQGKVMFKWEEFSLEEIVESVVYEMKAVLAEKHLHLTFDKMTLDSLPKVWADKNRVKQIVYNLVGNASKFTEVGGISISAKVEDDMIKVLIIDTGRGIPEEGQKMLFHKFQQASNSILTRDTTRGTGLGLYISKMLIENMGGHIALESSQLGKGTTFSFTLPIATNQAKQAHPAGPSERRETNSTSGLPSTTLSQELGEPIK